MQQVPGTYSLTWTEIKDLPLRTFNQLLADKIRMVKQAGGK